uniref:Uncharacterized protein n=1 Tax=Solanum tuberosum TaxID=4113 RepID=M1DJN8_SOLTU
MCREEVSIYKAFPHLGKYAKKSLDSPLPIPRLLKWNTTKNDNIIEGDPFKYKGKSTKVVHPYLTPTVCETKNNYLATLKTYVDEVKDKVLDALKAILKGVIVLTSSVENVEEGYLIDDDNFSATTVDDEILPLAIVNDDLAAVDEYFAEEVDEQMKEEEMKEEEKEQDEEKITKKKKTMKKRKRRS